MKAVIKNILFSIWNLFLSKKEQQNLFIMGHPRSGSSLLMHILTSNNEIIGFGEYFTIYRNQNDLLKAEFDIRRKANKLFKNYFYIANQVLHPSRTPDLDIFISKKIKIVFLIRKPKETLSSWAIISKKKKSVVNKEELVKKYIERLDHISKIINSIDKEQWFFLTYEDLIENTRNTLFNLTSFLSLKSQLEPLYSLQKYTQISGDPSHNIKKGEIFKTNSKQIHYEEKLMNLATEAYQNTLDIFESKTNESEKHF